MTRLLAEDLLLLCWDDEKGRLHQRCSTTVGPGVGGALVIDALLAGALVIADERVQVTGTDPGDLLLTEVVAAADRRRPPGVARLVQEVGTPSRYKAVRDRLVEQGVLRADRRRVLGIAAATRFPPADPAATEAVRERVRVLLTGRAAPAEAEPREVILAGLAAPTGAIDVLVARGERTQARRRAGAFSNPHATAPGAGQAVHEAQIAAMAAVAASVTAGTATPTAGASPGPELATGQVRDVGRDAGAEDGHVELPVEQPVEEPVADGPPAPERVDDPAADEPGAPAQAEEGPAAEVPSAQHPRADDAGAADRVGVGLGVGAALLIGIGVVGRRLAPRARRRSTDG